MLVKIAKTNRTPLNVLLWSGETHRASGVVRSGLGISDGEKCRNFGGPLSRYMIGWPAEIDFLRSCWCLRQVSGAEWNPPKSIIAHNLNLDHGRGICNSTHVLYSERHFRRDLCFLQYRRRFGRMIS